MLINRPVPNADLNGLRLHYERGGLGPALVLLHGIGGSARSWQHQLQGLGAAFDVIAWDMRGYGGSSDPSDAYPLSDVANDLVGLLDSLGVTQAHIGGLALGAAVALATYERFPNRVRSLILAGANVGHAELNVEERPAARTDVRAQSGADTAVATRAQTPALLSPEAPAELIAEGEGVMVDLHPDGYRLAAKALAEANLASVLPAIDAPTLVLCGELDEVNPVAESEYLAQRIPAARLELIPKAGHLCNQEQPDAFNGAVRRFLAPLG